METTLDLLAKQFKQLCDALDQAEPGTKEYHEIANDLKVIHDRILAEQKAEVDNEFRNIQEDRAERQLALEEAKEERIETEANKHWWEKIDANTIVSGIVTVGTTVLILDFEKLGNVTSKAMSFIPKPRNFK